MEMFTVVTTSYFATLKVPPPLPAATEQSIYSDTSGSVGYDWHMGTKRVRHESS